MNNGQFLRFKKARERFKNTVEELSRSLPNLQNIQQEFIDSRSNLKNSSYIVETPVVYNTALDNITVNDEIKIILVADNPGRREQAAENRRYLIGPSGKIAQKFFHNNSELGIDFTKNVIILNKTPIHSPRTIELRQLVSLEEKTGSSSISSALEKSQKVMASLLIEFHEALDVQIWITGYSEMKKGGLFEAYTNELKTLYAKKPELFKQLFIYRHFSMNQFTIDLKQQSLPKENLKQSLKKIGEAYKHRILG